MFVTQLIFSYLLSIVGFLVYYFGMRKHSTAWQRKFALYAIVGLSIALPFYFIHQTPTIFKTEIAHDQLTFHDEPLTTKDLLKCYKKARTQENFCHCEQTQQADMVLYQQNPYFDTMRQAKAPLWWFFSGIVGILILMLLLKMIYLEYLIKTSNHYKKRINGQIYIFLTHPKSLSPASFQLRKAYIVWNDGLNDLPLNEQEAIIQHEIAHLNNKDTWEHIFLHFIQMGWFINPVYYAVKRELNLINEYLADAFAVQKLGDAKLYAKLLIQMKERQQFGLLSQFGQHPFKSRIKAILQPTVSSKFIPLFIGLILTMIVVSAQIAPYFNAQSIQFEEYCHLQDEYHKSGKKEYCKSCLFEDVKKK